LSTIRLPGLQTTVLAVPRSIPKRDEKSICNALGSAFSYSPPPPLRTASGSIIPHLGSGGTP
jgi:hypothetical protein